MFKPGQRPGSPPECMRGGHGPFGTLPDIYKGTEKSGDTEAAVQDHGLRSYERDLFEQEDRDCMPAGQRNLKQQADM